MQFYMLVILDRVHMYANLKQNASGVDGEKKKKQEKEVCGRKEKDKLRRVCKILIFE